MKASNVKPLSNEDIVKKLSKYGIPIQFVIYKELKYLTSLEEILPCILLYQLMYPIGHWVAIFVNKEGINYWDPLGYIPDQLLKDNFQHPAGREAMNADYTYLAQLLLEYSEETGLPVIYNEIALQPPNTNTCGYFCGIRLLTNEMTNDEFNSVFKKYPTDKRQDIIVKLWKKL